MAEIRSGVLYSTPSVYDLRLRLEWEVVDIGWSSTNRYADIKWSLYGDNSDSDTAYVMAGMFQVWLEPTWTRGAFAGDRVVALDWPTTLPNKRIQLKNNTVVGFGTSRIVWPEHENDYVSYGVQFHIGGALYVSDYQNSTATENFDIQIAPKKATLRVPDKMYINSGSYPFTIVDYDPIGNYKIEYALRRVYPGGGSGTIYGTIVENYTSSSLRWSVPAEFYEYITESPETSIRFTVYTYLNEKRIGMDSSTTATIAVNEQYNLPEITNITITPQSGVAERLTGSSSKFILNYSRVDYSVTSTAKNYAKITATNIANAGQIQYGPTGSFPNPIASSSFTATVTDSRGFQAAEGVTVDAVDYVRLTMTAEVGEPNANGSAALNVEGKYWEGNFGVVENSLVLRYTLYIKEGNSWNELTPVDITPTFNTENNSYSANLTISGLDYTKEYQINVHANDELLSVNSGLMPIAVSPIFDWGQNDFNFNVPVTMQEGLIVEGDIEVGGILTHNGNEILTPRVTSWIPAVNMSSTRGRGYAIIIGELCILNFYIQCNVTTTTSKVTITGLPYDPDGTRWWAGGGNASGYLLYTNDTTFSGWCIEDLGDGEWGICGRACGVRSSNDTTTVTKNSSYIGAKGGDTFYASGTIMYRIAQ